MSMNYWVKVPSALIEVYLVDKKKSTKLEALVHLCQAFDAPGITKAFNRVALSKAFDWTDRQLTTLLDELCYAKLFTVIYDGETIHLTLHDKEEYKTDHLRKKTRTVTKDELYAVGQTWDAKTPPNPRLVPPGARIAFLEDGRWQIVPDPIITVPQKDDPFGQVKMKTSEWERLLNDWGEAEAEFMAYELQKYAETQPTKFAGYKSHYLTLQNWRRRKIERGYEFNHHDKHGWGYYLEGRRNGYAY